jgi:hypothetical protein
VRERSKKALGIIGWLATVWLSVTHFESPLIGLLLVEVAALVGLWGVWPWVGRLTPRLPGGSILLRSPFIRLAVTVTTPVAPPSGPDRRKIVRVWYETVAEESSAAALELARHLCVAMPSSNVLARTLEDTVQRQLLPRARLAADRMRQYVDSDRRDLDAGLLDEWDYCYGELLRLAYGLWWNRPEATKNAREPPHEKWKPLHRALFEKTAELFAVDEMKGWRRILQSLVAIGPDDQFVERFTGHPVARPLRP